MDEITVIEEMRLADLLAGREDLAEGERSDFERLLARRVQALLDELDFVGLSRAADECGVAYTTLVDAAKRGGLPVVQVGRNRYVRLEAVRHLVGLPRLAGRE